jgi:hypothetical protein
MNQLLLLSIRLRLALLLDIWPLLSEEELSLSEDD